MYDPDKLVFTMKSKRIVFWNTLGLNHFVMLQSHSESEKLEVVLEGILEYMDKLDDEISFKPLLKPK